MSTLDDFTQQLASAYEHLYDIGYLGTHAFHLFRPAAAPQPDATKDRAWQTHHALIKVVDELNPGGRAPVMSREWRRHRLMKLRYVDGLLPQEVADALAVSRRQYYRVHDEAMHALAELLLTERGTPWHPPALARDQLLRTELERYSDSGERASLPVIVESALSLLHDRLSQRGLRVYATISSDLPDLRADEKLFRQLLLSMIDFLAERSSHASLELTASPAHDTVELKLCITPTLANSQSQPVAFDELAALNGALVTPLVSDDRLHGFVITQPTVNRDKTPVLVVDDNEDTLELYRHYLAQEHIAVSIARNSAEVFDALLNVQPQAIFLDLMLPEQDGWDILQLLKNEPDARDIPVFICSVLKQNELALALGAAGFIQKPFTKDVLLAALKGIEDQESFLVSNDS